MDESLRSEKTVREYLLGRVSNETTLEGIEELLFTDEEFCSQVALAEDGLINDFVCGRLDNADAGSFQATLAVDAERRFKLELTQALREKALARGRKRAKDRTSFFTSLAAFFHQPKYVGAFAVLLIAVVSLTVFLFKRGNPDQLVELRSLYEKERPTETRISGFHYAPLTQLRGAPEPGEQKRLRRIEINLTDAAEKTPNAQTHHALGVCYLAEQKYPEAIKEFENALRYAENARIHNDLGVAHFELAKTEQKGKRFEDLAHSVEEFTRASELDGNLLEALFNRSLALQELGKREARDSWRLYLQKDPSSPWANEARENLKRIDGQITLLDKSDIRVLADFLTAYRDRDYPRAQEIHNETKGLLKTVAVPLQLSRRYLLAKQRGDAAEAKESVEILTFVGNFEQQQDSEFFFLN